MKRSLNKMYYDLIWAFDQRTVVPVLLNTSFNENEPIVHPPEQAVACFARTKMYVLGIGSFWCEKSAELAAEAEEEKEEDEKETRSVISRHPYHTWHIDFTVVPTLMSGLCAPWFPFALPQRWPFCWWVD